MQWPLVFLKGIRQYSPNHKDLHRHQRGRPPALQGTLSPIFQHPMSDIKVCLSFSVTYWCSEGVPSGDGCSDLLCLSHLVQTFSSELFFISSKVRLRDPSPLLHCTTMAQLQEGFRWHLRTQLPYLLKDTQTLIMRACSCVQTEFYCAFVQSRMNSFFLFLPADSLIFWWLNNLILLPLCCTMTLDIVQVPYERLPLVMY